MSDPALPSRTDALVHAAKVQAHRARRGVWDRLLAPPTPWDRAARPAGWRPLATSRSALRAAEDPSERALEAGKIHNLRLAARAFDGVYVPPGGELSFWAQLGRPTARRGFAVGRELRQGCLIPSVGGGLCQLSNALFDAAQQAGLPITERHAHSQIVPGSLAVQGRDATVFWNYVDLRFRAPRGLWVHCQLTDDSLEVRLHAPPGPGQANARGALRVLRGGAGRPAPNSCATCGQGSCFRNPAAVAQRLEGAPTAWVVDGVQPELDAVLRDTRGPDDAVLLPVDGRRLGWARYGWSTAGARVLTAPHLAARRALQARRLAAQGAERQQHQLADTAALAEALGRQIPVGCSHAVVSLSLLPHLHAQGWLGGRTVDVLVDRAPLHTLQGALDAAARRWPDSPTLADFRAPAALVEAERAGLARARLIYTAHPGLAALWPGRAVSLRWAPGARTARRRVGGDPVVLFPASTLGRHGAWALREAMAGRPATLLRCGPVLEAAEFWGARAVAGRFPDALAQADVVVWPGHVPGPPRRLLDALASGVPVITTPAAGLAGWPGVTEVPAGDVAALARALDDRLPAAAQAGGLALVGRSV